MSAGPVILEVEKISAHARIRVQREGGEVVRVVEVPGGRSMRDTVMAMQAARRDLAGVPEMLTRVEIQVDQHAAAQLDAARAKRMRRAQRGSR